MNNVTVENMHKNYVNHLSTGTKLRWNVLVAALAAGRTAKLDHMDVFDASFDLITAGDKKSGQVLMTFKREDILKAGIPQITHFNISYFNDKGEELKSKNPPDMDTGGAKPIQSSRRDNDHSHGF